MSKYIRLLILILAIGNPIHAQEAAEIHPIDQRFQDCLETEDGQTVPGMTKCNQLALQDWRAQMTRSYDQLLAELPEEQRVVLMDAQSSWTGFVENEQRFINTFFRGFEGAVWNVTRSEHIVLLYKNRVKDLERYHQRILER